MENFVVDTDVYSPDLPKSFLKRKLRGENMGSSKNQICPFALSYFFHFSFLLLSYFFHFSFLLFIYFFKLFKFTLPFFFRSEFTLLFFFFFSMFYQTVDFASFFFFLSTVGPWWLSPLFF